MKNKIIHSTLLFLTVSTISAMEQEKGDLPAGSIPTHNLSPKLFSPEHEGFTHPSELGENPSTLVQNRILVGHIERAFPPQTAQALLGCLYMMAGQHEKGFEYFEMAGEGVTKEIQNALNMAAYWGEFGFDDKSARAYLEERAEKGDIHARKKLYWGARYHKFGFDEKTGIEYLEERMAKGDALARSARYGFDIIGGDDLETEEDTTDDAQQQDDAQEDLNSDAYYGSGGFTDKTGLAYLKERAEIGDIHAQKLLNDAARFGGKFGFTSETGRAYLEARIAKGDKDAQKLLNSAAISKKLGFTEETGRAYLWNRAYLGDKFAQSLLKGNEVSPPSLFFPFYNLYMGGALLLSPSSQLVSHYA